MSFRLCLWEPWSCRGVAFWPISPCAGNWEHKAHGAFYVSPGRQKLARSERVLSCLCASKQLGPSRPINPLSQKYGLTPSPDGNGRYRLSRGGSWARGNQEAKRGRVGENEPRSRPTLDQIPVVASRLRQKKEEIRCASIDTDANLTDVNMICVEWTGVR